MEEVRSHEFIQGGPKLLGKIKTNKFYYVIILIYVMKFEVGHLPLLANS